MLSLGVATSDQKFNLVNTCILVFGGPHLLSFLSGASDSEPRVNMKMGEKQDSAMRRRGWYHIFVTTLPRDLPL